MAILEKLIGTLPLREAWRKIDRNEKAINDEIVNHKASTQAHDATAIKYDGKVVGAGNTKQAIDNVQEQVNTLVLNGDSSAAAAQAAIDANGHDYQNLKLRLDTEHTQLSEQLADKAQQTEIDRIDLEMMHRPTREEVDALFGALVDATPLFANDVSEMTDTSRVYVNLSDGFLYLHDGADWVNTGYKYTGDGVSDHSVGLDQLNDSTLITDYVKSNGLLNINGIVAGKYEANLVNKGDLYITNGNMFDLFRVPNGTYSQGGLTIVVNGNNIKITGTSPSNLYARLSENVVIAGNTNDAGVSMKNYKVPAITNFAYGFYNKTFNGPAGATFNIRSKVSGNISSLPMNTVQPYANLAYNENWGALYLFLPAGTYDVVFDTFLMPNTYDESKRISPSTKLLDNVRRARFELKENEYLVTNQTGTATPLVNVYENLQREHTDQVGRQLFVESHTDYFYYYIKGSNDESNKYLRYKFEHFERVDTKANAWVQTNVDAVELIDGIWNILYPVVIAGEWEMAVRIKDRPDFIGAKEHGSEVNTYLKFYVDGVSWVPNESSFWCSEIRVVQKSTLYDPLDEVTQVGNHTKVFTITPTNLHLKQKIDWVGTFDMDMSYVTMLPIARGNDAETSYLITAIAYDDYNLNEIDISQAGHAAKTYDTNATKWYLYSNSTGISAEVQSIIKNKPASATTFIQNTAKYNKVYFAYCNTGYTVNSGDAWEWESIYKLNIK